MRQGFRDLGHVEGRNITIEYRWADGHYDRLDALAAELVRLQPDVIITSGPGVALVKKATATVPVVMAAAGDVVAMRLVDSLAHPAATSRARPSSGRSCPRSVSRSSRVRCRVLPGSRCS